MALKFICSAGKSYLVVDGFKYREVRTNADGKISWRCCAKVCQSWVKTDSEKKKIMESKPDHNHKAQYDSPSQTPTTLRKPPAASTPAVTPRTPPVTPTPSTDTVTPQPPPPPSSSQSPSQLLAENNALKKQILELQKEIQVILDHSIESDQRLATFTDQVFVARPSTPANGLPPSTIDQHSQTIESNTDSVQRIQTIHTLNSEKQSLHHTITEKEEQIRDLESKIALLERPCQKCNILQEELTNMISSIKSLEEELNSMKNISQTGLSGQYQQHFNISTQNSFDALTQLSDEETGFVVVKKKSKNKNHRISNKTKSLNKVKNKNQSPKFKKIKLPFKSISIVGDSHARNIASLMCETVERSTVINGLCMPGAGLLQLPPVAPPPPDNCVVLICGNNDVSAERQSIISSHMEEIIVNHGKKSKVLVTPLFPRHDLAPGSPVHQNIELFNAYIAELCIRIDGAEMLDTQTIRRHHFTAHGQHLGVSGKHLLASLIAARLASMTPWPKQRRPVDDCSSSPASLTTTPPSPEATPTVISPGERSFAEAVGTKVDTVVKSQQKTVQKPNKILNVKCSTSIFLGNPLLANKKN